MWNSDSLLSVGFPPKPSSFSNFSSPMNSLTAAFARVCLSLALISSFGSAALAADQTIDGNLFVDGDTDLGGNTLSFGTRTDSGIIPGLNLLYSDATVPTIYFNATRPTANWLWQSVDGAALQMRLDATNTLSLTDPATGTVSILLNPSPSVGATFPGPVLIAGNVGIGVISPAAKLDVAGNVKIQGNLTVTGTNISLPNQALTGGESILTRSLADARYQMASGGFAEGYFSAAMSGGGATGSYSTAMGNGYAAGDYSIASGSGEAYGYGSTALGGGLAFGNGSICAGSGVASGEASVAMGGSAAYGNRSVAMGGSAAGGDYSIAGSAGQAEGDYSTAMGQGYSLGWGSVALSTGRAQGDFSTAIGLHVAANGFGQVAIGRNNVVQGSATGLVGTDDLFIIGNGAVTGSYASNPYNALVAYVAGPPSNAFVVHHDGNTRAQGKVESKGGFRTPPMGDLGMGGFTAGTNPADPVNGLNSGLRYPTE